MNTLLTDEQLLVSATYGRGNYEIPTYDDGFGQLYVLRDSMGIRGIVRAQSWETAYEICEDEFFLEADETIEDIVREYGFKREHHKVVRDLGVLVAGEHTGVGERFATGLDYPDGKLLPEFIRWQTVETPDPDAWADNELFQEAFGFRPNGPNATDTIKHGIYAKDLNGEYLDVLTPALAAKLGITVNTKPWAHDSEQ